MDPDGRFNWFPLYYTLLGVQNDYRETGLPPAQIKWQTLQWCPKVIESLLPQGYFSGYK